MLRLLFAALALVPFAFPLRADATVALPLSNLSKDPNLDWIGESIAENILESLHSEGLVILDRSDRAEAYQRLSLRPYAPLLRASAVKIGDELDASHTVFGSFEIVRAPDAPAEAKPSIVCKVRVLDLRKLRQSEELVESGSLDDLAAIQNRIAWKVLNQIQPQAPESQQQFMEHRPNVRIDAIENYVRGLLATDPAARHRFFTQAARLDPSYSQPCFQLGIFYWDKEEYQQAAKWFHKVADKDVHFHEALFYYGICQHYLADYAMAEHAFRTVAASVPLNEVFSNFGATLLRLNRLDEAAVNIGKALEGDSADPDYHFNLGYVLWHAKRYNEAAERFRAVLERIPDDQQATSLLGFCLKQEPPRPGDTRYEGLERMKEDYEERVFRQLKSMVEKK